MFVLQSCMYVLYKESVYDVFRLHKILGLAHRGNYGRTFLVCIIAGLDTNILVEFVEIWLLTFILVCRIHCIDTNLHDPFVNFLKLTFIFHVKFVEILSQSVWKIIAYTLILLVKFVNCLF